jgi:hypothetical protein
LVAKFKYNAKNSYTCPQEETLKPQEGGIKSGRTEQSGYQFKIQNPSLQQCSVQHLCTRSAGREIDRIQYVQGVEKITNAIKNPHYTTRQN